MLHTHFDQAHFEALVRWLYAAGTATAATVTSIELTDHSTAVLLAVLHIIASAVVAISRKPRTQHRRARKQPPCHKRL